MKRGFSLSRVLSGASLLALCSCEADVGTVRARPGDTAPSPSPSVSPSKQASMTSVQPTGIPTLEEIPLLNVGFYSSQEMSGCNGYAHTVDFRYAHGKVTEALATIRQCAPDLFTSTSVETALRFRISDPSSLAVLLDKFRAVNVAVTLPSFSPCGKTSTWFERSTLRSGQSMTEKGSKGGCGNIGILDSESYEMALQMLLDVVRTMGVLEGKGAEKSPPTSEDFLKTIQFFAADKTCTKDSHCLQKTISTPQGCFTLNYSTHVASKSRMDMVAAQYELTVSNGKVCEGTIQPPPRCVTLGKTFCSDSL